MRVAAAVLKLKEKRIIKTCATAQNSARCADFCVLQNFKKMGFKNVSFHADITIFRISVYRAEICAALKIHLTFESYESCVDFFYVSVR